MKSSAKRFWPLIPLILWIILYAVIAGVIAYVTKIHDLYLLVLIDIINIFDLVWYLISCTRNNETGVINKAGNWIVLDFPAVIMINHWFRIKKQEEQRINAKSKIYVKGSEDAEQKDLDEYDITLADWEKEILKKKNAKKYAKYVKEEHAEQMVDYKIQEERKIIRGFSVYAMYNIYLKDPKIVNTYNIINQYKDMVEDNVLRTKMINEFAKTSKLGTFIENYDAKTMTAKMISDVLTKTEPAEFEVAFKQDRVQIMIDAKDNWYQRTKKPTSKKKSTK